MRRRLSGARRTSALALLLVVGALVLSACQDAIPKGVAAGTSSSSSTTSAQPTPATLSISPADGSTDVLPNAPVTVTATTGTLSSVTLSDASGNTISGTTSASGTWTADRFLKPATTYTLTVAADGPGGDPTKATSTFTTHKPAITATYGIVYNGQTVGVGMPVSIQFDSAVTSPQYRAEVQKQVSVSVTPKQEGSWGWLDNRQLMYRPKTYWKPGTVIKINAPLTGVQTGSDKWVANDEHGTYRIGQSMISTVNIKTHEMSVRENGKLLKVIPVSTGRPGPETETRSGTKVIITKQPTVVMDSSTIGIPKGDPGYYKITTHWDLRVTWTGEFLHSAPWSVNAQGTENVSHGCTNLSPENAKWMYEHSRVGDVVKFTGSSRVFQPTEGIGVWQYTWDAWQKQSALAAA